MASLPVGIQGLTAGPVVVRSRAGLDAIAGRFLFAWLLVRTLIWALVMTARPNPPLDVIEWLSWGQHWQLGYHKHPPLAAWIAEIAWTLTPGSFLGIYLAGYLAVALALGCVWNLARKVLPLRAALAATLCLDGLVFLGSGAGEFNNQVLLVGFWALVIDRAFAAWREDKLRDWVLTGVALGLALLCKYSVVLLLFPLLGWWFWQSGLRRLSRVAIVAAVSGAIFLPHLVWLWQNDWITLRYASRRAHGDPDSPSVLVTLGLFAWSQGVRLMPMLLILAPMLWKPQRCASQVARARSFVLVAVIGPIVLHILLGLMPGARLRDIWGVPLYSFAGVALLLFFGANETAPAWRRFRLSWGIVGGATLVVVGVIQVLGWPAHEIPHRVEFPGAALAMEVSQRYTQRHGVPPAIAAGDWWLAGNICCFAPGRPVLYGSREPAHPGLDIRHVQGDPRRFCSPEPETSPWTCDADLISRGGVLVWCAEAYGDDLPGWLQTRFPTAQGQPMIALPWPPCGPRRVRVGWAMVPPAKP